MAKKKRQYYYEVEIKSLALLREGKRGLVTYFKGGPKELIASNCRKIYPQYTKPEDNPIVNIRKIPFREIKRIQEGGQITQKQTMYQTKKHVLKEEDYVTVADKG